jgi:phosphoribosylanthranilate isomerase
MRVKICGITDLEQGLAIANLGADTLGFICVEKSPRYVNNEIIKNIIQQLPKEISKIGVFVNENIDNVIKIVQETGLTGIQLHGEESPAICAQLREFLSDIEIIKAFRCQNSESLTLLNSYIPVIDTILLDAYQQGVYGGTGKTLNWLQLADFRPSRPWLLAGGINTDNVLTALETVECDGIDVSSGVEISPRNKDLEKVRLLFQKLNTLITNSIL